MPIRVLVAEDSLTVRDHLCGVLSNHADMEIVGEASTGRRAVELCQTLRPHVVTMDMMMPEMTGLEATEQIMGHCPTPILIVSSSFNRGELFKMYEALSAGAVDVLEKPPGDERNAAWEQRFIEAVRLTSRIRVITHPRARLKSLSRAVPDVAPTSAASAGLQLHRVIAIGASTGGPAAIVDVLRTLPSPLPVPVLLVLHIAEPFGTAFAEWLGQQTGHRVGYPRDGALVLGGPEQVLMAPPGQHMVVRGGRVFLTHDAPRHSCRPSVDVLFDSVAQAYGSGATAVLLTGMGRDGAAGLLQIRRAGGRTIAQDEATSVVFGMPREAIALGAAELVLPLGDIGPTLAAFRSSREVRRS